MVIIAMPSYGGRCPVPAIERLKQIKGNCADCIVVAVYGNRAYDDTHVELEDTARHLGFNVIAGISAVAEHSIMHQYATNRPDFSDKEQLANFAKMILNRNDYDLTTIPGKRPYKKNMPGGIVPKPNKDCAKCGICAKECPVKAINCKDFKANSKKCISCMRCVSACPHNARKVNKMLVSVGAMTIKKACSVRKEYELFLLK